MISYLAGKILNKGTGYAVLAVERVGYRVFVTPTHYAELSIGQEASIYTHQYVREDALDLYGFRNHEELELFELLISISGIGPKSALGVMSVAKIDDIKESIARGDSALLTKVSGIGRKTAERLVLELREKIAKLGRSSGLSGDAFSGSGDEIDALVSLGYSIGEARGALQQVNPQITDSGERIRQALKKIGR